MCGIVGIKGQTKIDKSIVKLMNSEILYRGPDDFGYWIGDNSSIALGHRRLSILDVSDAGRQPMHYCGQRFHIVFNGEIYNYLELRKELIGKGYTFRTNTDTEVIMASYQEWGIDCQKRFNGMWAFAIWDNVKKQLFLSRDRVGVKPLYYYHDNKAVYFASEIKSILKVVEERPEINHFLIDTFMSFGYVPGGDSLLKGMKRLLPGHYMLVGNNNDISIKKYWDLTISNERDLGLDYYVEKGRYLLNDSIDLRLRSDVPLGIFLSGGLDSSAVVGLLAERMSKPLKTFSMGYDFGSDFNETKYARMVADRFATEHHEIMVSPNEFKNFIPDFIKHMDEPVTEAAAISLYYLSKLAKEHVTVALSGEGSDELFGGYDFYKYMMAIEKFRGFFGGRLADLGGRASAVMFPDNSKISKYLKLASMPLSCRYKGISTYDESIKNHLYLKGYKEQLAHKDPNIGVEKFLAKLFKKTTDNDSLSQMLYFDMKTWLADDLLIKADRMSMATSLELRVPFLDYRLIEFAATIPSKYKIKNGNVKYILKQMVSDVLPDQIINRKKMGFPTPLKVMFQGVLSEFSFSVLLDNAAKVHNYFDKFYIEKILKEHKRKIADHHRLIWQLLVLELWMQNSQNG